MGYSRTVNKWGLVVYFGSGAELLLLYIQLIISTLV